MRTLFLVFSFITLAGCTSLGGVMTSETTWFQDWSCARQDGVCARTDTIDAITITELDSDPAEAGPVSGYPAESLPLSASPKKLRGIQPFDFEEFDDEIERGRPFIETSFGDEELLAAPAMLSQPSFSIDSAFDGDMDEPVSGAEDPFWAAFPEAAVQAQFAVLSDKMGLVSEGVDATLISAETASSDTTRLTRTVVRRDGVLVPEDERVTELIPGLAEPMNSEPALETYAASDAAARLDAALETGGRVATPVPERQASRGTPRRSNAKVLPVIISPYVDARGIYHERSVIWVEVEPADWVVE